MSSFKTTTNTPVGFSKSNIYVKTASSIIFFELQATLKNLETRTEKWMYKRQFYAQANGTWNI